MQKKLIDLLIDSKIKIIKDSLFDKLILGYHFFKKCNVNIDSNKQTISVICYLSDEDRKYLFSLIKRFKKPGLLKLLIGTGIYGSDYILPYIGELSYMLYTDLAKKNKWKQPVKVTPIIERFKIGCSIQPINPSKRKENIVELIKECDKEVFREIEKKKLLLKIASRSNKEKDRERKATSKVLDSLVQKRHKSFQSILNEYVKRMINARLIDNDFNELVPLNEFLSRLKKVAKKIVNNGQPVFSKEPCPICKEKFEILTGQEKRTCSDKCRQKLFRANHP